jgi:hypothetical protein
VNEPLRWVLSAGREALAAVVIEPSELAAALDRLGLGGSRPALVLVGGAGGLHSDLHAPLLALFRGLMPALRELGAVVVDGGTRSGVMALMGQAAAGTDLHLLGVVAVGTVRLPGQAEPGPHEHRPELDPNHDRFLLVPGTAWGDESPWIAAVATALVPTGASLTLVIGGGKVTALDLREGLRHGRPALVLAGSGGTADAVATYLQGSAGPVGAPPFDLPQDTAARCEVMHLDRAATELPALLRRRLGG